ncbi:MAG: DNA polymerase [Myxococcota bacterium]
MSEPEVLRELGPLEAFLASVSDAPFLALDTETSGLDPHKDRVLLLQVGTATRQVLVDAAAVGPEAIRAIFDDRLIVMHNASFDLKMLMATYGDAAGLRSARVGDSQTCEQLLRNGRRSDVVMQGYSLKALAERYAGMELDKSIRQGFYGIQSLSELSSTELHYALRDVEATWKVFASQLPELERDGLTRVAGIEGAAAPAFAELELTGFPVDVDAWGSRLAEARGRSESTRRALDWEFREVADRDLFGGSTLNFDSDEEVLEALGRLGIRVQSTRRDALMATGHPAAAAVAAHREQQKIVSTYGESFIALAHEVTGRLHPRFKAIGAQTGRSACSEPNLQNIPSDSSFRSCFRAAEGRVLVTADYAGAELRILAEMSEDPVFSRAFMDGLDLHAAVASRLFGRRVDKESEPELRARAKAINFGLAYGMGAGGLAAQLGIPEREAEQLMQAHFRAFPRIRAFLEDAARQALRRGFGETMAGRKLWFTDMRRDGRDEGTLTRIAKNMPIQGTNADITKIALARLVRAFAREGLKARLVNMVHDEIVVELPEAEGEAGAEILRKEMIAAGAALLRKTPVEVDVMTSPSWTKG